MKIVIVGGGTTGWMVTKYLSKSHQCVNISTDEIPIIGVGEGTTGRFPTVFKMNPVDLLLGMDALPKLGIKFDGWSTTRDTFWSPIDGGSSTAIEYFLDYSLYACGPTSHFTRLMEGNKSNFYVEHPYIMSDINSHAVHIDAYKTSAFFKQKCFEEFNTKHYNDKIVGVNRDIEGNIISVKLPGDVIVEGDLFVDCSGFLKVLSNHIEWIDYSKYLPVNSAVVYRTEEPTVRRPYTTAKAMKYGWTWEIPTRNKIGRGYVYCDKYASEEDILKELGDVEKVKSIKFNSGRLKTFLNNNCVTMGLASGFLEPLQATSIHTSIVQMDLLVYNFPTKQSLKDQILIDQYNDMMSRYWDKMRDFVSVHYTGGKKDSEFWTNIEFPETVQRIVHLAKTRLTRSFDFQDRITGDVGQEAWNPTLWGLGHFDKCNIQEIFASDGTNIENVKKFFSDRIDTTKYIDVEYLNTLLRSHGET